MLRASSRNKEGKRHQYRSIVDNPRLADGRVRQRHVLFLGEIDRAQERAWRKSVAVFTSEGKNWQGTRRSYLCESMARTPRRAEHAK